MEIKTAEYARNGHPDRVADIMADSILDECLKQDSNTRSAIEVFGCHGIVYVGGELTTKAYVDIPKIVRKVYKEIGYKDSIGVQTNIVSQSPEISDLANDGAGDSGIVTGYATNETEEMLPIEVVLAKEIADSLDKRMMAFPSGKELLPDGKIQVTIDEGIATNVVIAYQSKCKVCDGLVEGRAIEVLMDYDCYDNKETKIDIIRFEVGGFSADTGLTGRKNAIWYGPSVPIGGGSFCLDGETEFLTPTGWKKLSEYVKGDKVAEYNKDGSIDFKKPTKYIKEPVESMYKVSGSGLNMVLTGNHRVPYITSKNNLSVRTFSEIKVLHESSSLGFGGRIIPFYSGGGEGIDLSDDEIRLQIAFMADGTLVYEPSSKVRFRLLRDRKIKRLKDILDRLEQSYDVRHYADRYTYIYTTVPFTEKKFNSYWWKSNKNQMEVIAKEVVKWDGEERIFRTTIKESADFIQHVFSNVYQTKSSILIDDRIGEEYGGGYIRKSILYTVRAGKVGYVSLKRRKGKKLKIKEHIPKDGLQYCFTTESGMFLARRENCIFVTGNSGKDATKVDRSGAYLARKIACSYVTGKIYEKCLVEIAYTMGKDNPLYIKANGKKIKFGINENDTSVKDTIKTLGLNKPIFKESSLKGHFGCGFNWEK